MDPCLRRDDGIMEYIKKKVIVGFSVVVATYQVGDWGQVHTNGGDGEINWDTPVGPKVLLITPQTQIAGGIAAIKVTVRVDVPGTWRFGVKVWDKYNNVQVGDSIEESEYIDMVPLYPAGMSGESYDYEESELVLALI
jgi:hypothetical protein